jgi:hypothetical protein
MQQVVRLEIWVPQEASRAVKSMLPVESHFSFDFTQFSIAWYWLPQAPAKEFWQEVMSADVRAGSFAQLLLSEHEASLLPQPANAITATVIAAKKSFFISCPSKFDFGKCGHIPNGGAQVTPPREAAQEGCCPNRSAIARAARYWPAAFMQACIQPSARTRNRLLAEANLFHELLVVPEIRPAPHPLNRSTEFRHVPSRCHPPVLDVGSNLLACREGPHQVAIRSQTPIDFAPEGIAHEARGFS